MSTGPRTAAQILAGIPGYLRPLVEVIVSRQIRRTCWAQGLGRLPEQVLLDELAHRLDDLCMVLGEQRFFHGVELSVADLAIYGQLHMLRSWPTPEAETLISQRPMLLRHMQAVEEVTA